MQKINDVLKNSAESSLKTILFLIIPAVIVSLIFLLDSFSGEVTNFLSVAFSFNFSFWSGLIVSSLSVFFMFFTFYTHDKLSSMPRADLLSLSNGFLLKWISLLSFFFSIYVWYLGVSGIDLTTNAPFARGSATYHFVLIGLLMPLPFLLYLFFEKILFWNSKKDQSPSIELTVACTLMSLIMYIIHWMLPASKISLHI